MMIFVLILAVTTLLDLTAGQGFAATGVTWAPPFTVIMFKHSEQQVTQCLELDGTGTLRVAYCDHRNQHQLFKWGDNGNLLMRNENDPKKPVFQCLTVTADFTNPVFDTSLLASDPLRADITPAGQWVVAAESTTECQTFRIDGEFLAVGQAGDTSVVVDMVWNAADAIMELVYHDASLSTYTIESVAFYETLSFAISHEIGLVLSNAWKKVYADFKEDETKDFLIDLNAEIAKSMNDKKWQSQCEKYVTEVSVSQLTEYTVGGNNNVFVNLAFILNVPFFEIGKRDAKCFTTILEKAFTASSSLSLLAGTKVTAETEYKAGDPPVVSVVVPVEGPQVPTWHCLSVQQTKGDRWNYYLALDTEATFDPFKGQTQCTKREQLFQFADGTMRHIETGLCPSADADGVVLMVKSPCDQVSVRTDGDFQSSAFKQFGFVDGWLVLSGTHPEYTLQTHSLDFSGKWWSVSAQTSWTTSSDVFHVKLTQTASIVASFALVLTNKWDEDYADITTTKYEELYYEIVRTMYHSLVLRKNFKFIKWFTSMDIEAFQKVDIEGSSKTLAIFSFTLKQEYKHTIDKRLEAGFLQVLVGDLVQTGTTITTYHRSNTARFKVHREVAIVNNELGEISTAEECLSANVKDNKVVIEACDPYNAYQWFDTALIENKKVAVDKGLTDDFSAAAAAGGAQTTKDNKATIYCMFFGGCLKADAAKQVISIVEFDQDDRPEENNKKAVIDFIPDKCDPFFTLAVPTDIEDTDGGNIFLDSDTEVASYIGWNGPEIPMYLSWDKEDKKMILHGRYEDSTQFVQQSFSSVFTKALESATAG